MKRDLSIIIVNYNTRDLLGKCIDSIKTSNPAISIEIIVVDNNSSYDIASQIHKLTTDKIPITLIKNKKNEGFGKANNQGVHVANAEYVLLLNTDTEILDSAIDKIYRFTSRQEKSVIVGPKLLNPDKSPQSSCAPFFSPSVVFAMLFLKGDSLGITRYSPSDTKEVDWVSGACFLMKKEDYESLDGFDEGIFMYMEEVELMMRAERKGIRVYCYPEAQIVHIGAATSGSRKSPVLNIYRGLLYLYSKHYSKNATHLVQLMLKTKAYISLLLGTLTGNEYLISTYGEALQIVKKEK